MASKDFQVRPGDLQRLGANWDGSGTNFALFSAHAEKVELCLFDSAGKREIKRLTLPEYTHEVWHGYLPGVGPGQLYGYRVYGPYEPEYGHRFNHHKLLIDPYARALTGTLHWDDALFGYTVGDPEADLSFDERDSAPFVPKCVVVDAGPEEGLRMAPRPWHESVIYEMHVRGFTMQHPGVPKRLRGTFAGLARKPVVDYLRGLGVTAVELLPIHAFIDDRHLVERGLSNYWGYNSIGFFAPHPAYVATDGCRELRSFVRKMHDANIEVILDVVYNHTAEGNQAGPTLSFRGIDNHSYYHLEVGEERYYADYTGTGNALELRHRRVIQLVMDSLRYWVEQIGVDGFRFDLATTLARVDGEFSEHSSFLDAVGQDPLLSSVKLIAEPWDIGPDGYRVGAFPPGWAEWNDRYRDTVRRFWKGDDGQAGDFASRFCASADIYDRRGRRAWASVNFVTAHDGFTLRDLVSYDRKHNEANGEDGRDGSDHNFSWNCGAEGPTDDPRVQRLRRRQQRNFLATLLLSQGTPMLVAGDELGRTQGGNNNAYCQDDETSWIDWDGISADGEALREFVRRLIALRHEHVVFHRNRFLRGHTIPGTTEKDVIWLRPDGEEMTPAEWDDPATKALGLRLSGIAGPSHRGGSEDAGGDQTFVLFINASAEDLHFCLPEEVGQVTWEALIDTHEESGEPRTTIDNNQVTVNARSLRLFQLERADQGKR